MPTQDEIRSAKGRARDVFGRLRGVVGFGVGDGTLRVYVTDEAAGDALPASFERIPIEIVVSGKIHATPPGPPPPPATDQAKPRR